MSYDVVLSEAVREMIASWKLPKRLQDEITYRLKEDLTDQPASRLCVIRGARDVLEYSFVTDGGDPHAPSGLFTAGIALHWSSGTANTSARDRTLDNRNCPCRRRD